MARVLLSQGMVRPGVVQGQHWGLSISDATYFASLSRNSWMAPRIGITASDEALRRKPVEGPRCILGPDGDCIPLHIFGRPPGPCSHADPRLAHRVER